ncbi:hypothetical protein ACWEOD_04000 [Micrococcus luteus]|nr:hypothetical protein [Micrococcus luteus]MCV7610001.1 hypothetical protein [Micrococcus luteus]
MSNETPIPDRCPTCGGVIRLQKEIEPSIAGGKVWRCNKGCFEQR